MILNNRFERVLMCILTLLLISGCGQQIDSPNPVTPTDDGKPVISHKEENDDYKQDVLIYDDLDSVPLKYSKEQAIQDGVVICDVDDKIINEKYLQLFFEKYKKGEQAMVRTLVYTDEGDPVITDVVWDKQRFISTTDFSRDFYAPEKKKIVKKYKYLVMSKDQLYLSKHESINDTNDCEIFGHIVNKKIWKGYDIKA